AVDDELLLHRRALREALGDVRDAVAVAIGQHRMARHHLLVQTPRLRRHGVDAVVGDAVHRDLRHDPILRCPARSRRAAGVIGPGSGPLEARPYFDSSKRYWTNDMTAPS